MSAADCWKPHRAGGPPRAARGALTPSVDFGRRLLEAHNTRGPPHAARGLEPGEVDAGCCRRRPVRLVPARGNVAVHERRLVIECDSYWHMGREAKVRDAQCDAAVRAVGYTVVRLRSDEINADVVHAVQRALAAVDDMEVVLFA